MMLGLAQSTKPAPAAQDGTPNNVEAANMRRPLTCRRWLPDGGKAISGARGLADATSA